MTAVSICCAARQGWWRGRRTAAAHTHRH